MKKLVLASNNAGKLKEFQRLLGALAIEVIPQGQLGVGEAEEPHATFVENALAKARHAAAATGLPALADDSGICVPALGGAPGVYSARYGGEPKSDARNNQKLVADMAGQADRRAFYYAVLVLVRTADDPRPLIAEGRFDGELLAEPRGEGGFGYDPHFWVPALGKTVAELTPEEKNPISHRGQALAALLDKLAKDAL
ncbi:RdgB/HAM1 family non-canonical purine NTP pyrophosphatase [Chitinimonas viridis]|uniref:dITP/XTP pyrophosphatase n=2 Tax=Chitinimonas TaxID=240411 RepID=A0ABT8B1B3_9NEIS|nr:MULTISPECIES: RdgB/HAM1 family non-canonical purine NTP pyrophosphatase [Chitinimonas]MDN3575805.1 RdgB/HAM1 family non-canonical purine NTP pyrophosphatase [Chitinimonas viridis]GLR13920.1 non-canonical purine NTP pyrophosphatase [Chitinimonas prasina]